MYQDWISWISNRLVSSAPENNRSKAEKKKKTRFGLLNPWLPMWVVLCYEDLWAQNCSGIPIWRRGFDGAERAGDICPSALSRWQALPQRAPTCSCFERAKESNVKIASSPCCYFDTNPPGPRPVTAEKDDLWNTQASLRLPAWRSKCWGCGRTDESGWGEAEIKACCIARIAPRPPQ